MIDYPQENGGESLPTGCNFIMLPESEAHLGVVTCP